MLGAAKLCVSCMFWLISVCGQPKISAPQRTQRSRRRRWLLLSLCLAPKYDDRFSDIHEACCFLFFFPSPYFYLYLYMRHEQTFACTSVVNRLRRRCGHVVYHKMAIKNRARFVAARTSSTTNRCSGDWRANSPCEERMRDVERCAFPD